MITRRQADGATWQAAVGEFNLDGKVTGDDYSFVDSKFSDGAVEPGGF